MNVIVTLDDNNAVGFNHRRQSRDRILNEDVLNLAKDNLWVSGYSASLFPLAKTDENYLVQAGEDDYCFAEMQALAPYEKSIQKIIVYRWNRDYPFDQLFDLDLSTWNLLSEIEFAGSSHEKITRQIYENPNYQSQS